MFDDINEFEKESDIQRREENTENQEGINI